MVSVDQLMPLTKNLNGETIHYYIFLERLAELMKPDLSLELGSWMGYSSAALADGYPAGKVITVDICDNVLLNWRRQNVEYRIHESLQLIPDLGKLDILFIDTEHDGTRPLYEFELYKDYVKPGGIILFDDINLNPQMRDFWEDLVLQEYEKFELPVHFEAGFGGLIKKMA